MNKCLRWLCIVTGLYGLSWLYADTSKIAFKEPLRDFHLPFFNEKGYISRELSGKEGFYKGLNCLRITDMVLETFSETADGDKISALYSPEAIFELDTHDAFGDKTLQMSGQGYSVFGDRWIWNGRQKAASIRRRVQVIFESQAKL